MLRALMDANGWTQAVTAARLGISQGHLSKVLRGRHRAGRRLAASLSRATDAEPKRSPWLAEVSKAADASADFRAAVEAMLRLMH